MNIFHATLACPRPRSRHNLERVRGIHFENQDVDHMKTHVAHTGGREEGATNTAAAMPGRDTPVTDIMPFKDAGVTIIMET